MAKEWHKVIVMGSKSVGKSSFILRKQCNVFTETLSTKTIVRDFVETTHNYNETSYNLRLYERKSQSTGVENPMFFLDAEGAIVLYSCKQAETCRDIGSLISQVKANFQDERSIPIVICATHCDASFDNKEIEFTKVEKLYNGMPEIEGCVQTSAKTGRGIEEAIDLIVRGINRREKSRSGKRGMDDSSECSSPVPVPWICSCCFFY